MVAEALAAGCPAVVPAAGGPAESVDQACARTFAPGDADAAARALVEILTDAELQASMGAAGRAPRDGSLARDTVACAVRRREHVAVLGRPRPRPEVSRS